MTAQRQRTQVSECHENDFTQPTKTATAMMDNPQIMDDALQVLPNYAWGRCVASAGH